MLAIGWSFLMTTLSQRSDVKTQLKNIQPNDNWSPEDATFLNLRFGGYSRDDVNTHWEALQSLNLQDISALDLEVRFISLDFFFPIFYGLALIFGILLAGHNTLSNWRFKLIATSPVLLTAIADWIENAIHWQQIHRFQQSSQLVDGTWIAVASVATQVKLIGFIISLLVLVILVINSFLDKLKRRDKN